MEEELVIRRAGVDTFVFAPDIFKQDALSYWMGENTYCYVAECNGEILGTYMMKDNQPSLGSHIGNASYMVSSKARGKSVGRKMGANSLEEAKKIGYIAVQFNIVISTNVPAVALWQSLGFEIIGTVPNGFAHQGLNKFVDTYIMYRAL